MLGGRPGVIDVCALMITCAWLRVPCRHVVTAVDQQADPAGLLKSISDSPSGPEGGDQSPPGRQADNGQSSWLLAATCPVLVP